jgi:Flp pilus assembly protein TadG
VTTSVFRRSHPRLRGDDGAVLVEFALVLPLLALLLLGVFEYGSAYRETLNMASAVRVASRQAANVGSGRSADYLALQSFNSVMGSAKNITVQKVVIYKTTSANGDPLDPSCFTSATPSAGFQCNVYTGTQIANLGASYLTNFGPTDTACTASWDVKWCPLVRKDMQSDPPDYLGVYAVITYKGVTSIIPGTRTFTDRAVARIEPRVT